MIKRKIVAIMMTLAMIVTLLPTTTVTTNVAAASSSPNRRVVGYLPSYRTGSVGSIDFSAMTHCILSFMTYANGTLTSGFSGGDVQNIVSKCHSNGVKAMIAIGGWNGFNTSDGAFNDAGRRTSIINQIMNYVDTYNLDGVDLDLEVNDGNVWNYFDAFCSELSGKLKAKGKLLTMAVATWFTDPVANSTYNYFDFINLMSYDENQGNGPVASMNMVNNMLSYYGNRGVSNDRMTIGVPFYGYGAGGTAYTYAEILAMNSANSTRDEYNGIYYNGATTIRQKAELSKSYGGTMIWEVAQDSFGSGSLLAVIKDVMASGADNPTQAATTKKPEETTPKPTQATTTKVDINTNVDYSTASYLGDGARAGALANTFKAVIAGGAIHEVVNIQDKNGIAGIYMNLTDADFGRIAINGSTSEEIVDGAGVWINVEHLTKRDNEVTFYNNDGSVKGAVRILNESRNDDGSLVTTQAPTTTPKPTTKAGETEQNTTKQSGNSGSGEYANLTYTSLECSGSSIVPAIEYAIEDGATIEGIVPWYGDGGSTFLIQYADTNAEGADATVTINGQAAPKSIVKEKGNGLVKVDPNKLITNAYSAVTITLNSGKTATIVIKKGDPSKDPIEPTTKDNTTTKAGESQTTKKDIKDASELSFEEIECEGSSSAEVLGFAVWDATLAGVLPWYGDNGHTFMLKFADMNGEGNKATVTVDGGEPAHGIVTEKSVGLTKIDPTKLTGNAYTTITVTLPSGEYATFVIRKGDPTQDPIYVTTKDSSTTTKAGEQRPTDENGQPVNDPAYLNYEQVSCDGFDNIDPINYALQDATIAGVLPWYGDAGSTFMLKFADPEAEGTLAEVTVNGEEAAHGVVTEKSIGLVKINPTRLENNAYSTITVTLPSGKYATFVIKRGDPNLGPDETTTKEVITDENGEVITEAPTEFNLSNLNYEEIECEGDEKIEHIFYAMTDSTIAGVMPWYGDKGGTFMIKFADPNNEGSKAVVTLNGEEANKRVVTEKATGLVKINPKSLPKNSYSVITITLASGNSVTVVLKKGDPESVVATTPAEETMDPSAIAAMQGASFEGYVGTDWANARGTIVQKTNGDIHADIQSNGVAGNDKIWALQAKLLGASLQVGEIYEYSAILSASKNKTVYIKISYPAVEGVSEEEEVVYERVDLKARVPYHYSVKFGAGKDKVDVVYAFARPMDEDEVTDFTLDIAANKLAIAAPETEPSTTTRRVQPTTTPRVTTARPTTAEPTTTEAPTMTTKAPTTVAPTTVKPTIKVGKTKVKKATAKKNDTKAKVSLKKITGAKGYQVAIYKTKKDAKKNKKALVKKVVKKVSATIKSAKFKKAEALFVRARAYAFDADDNKVYGKWSGIKKAKIK